MSRRLIIGLLAGTILVAVFFFAVAFSFRRLPPGSVRPHSKPALIQPTKATQEATNLPAASKLPVINSSEGPAALAGGGDSSKNHSREVAEPEPAEASPDSGSKVSKITDNLLGNSQNNLTSSLQNALTNISSVFN